MTARQPIWRKRPVPRPAKAPATPAELAAHYRGRCACLSGAVGGYSSPVAAWLLQQAGWVELPTDWWAFAGSMIAIFIIGAATGKLLGTIYNRSMANWIERKALAQQ